MDKRNEPKSQIYGSIKKGGREFSFSSAVKNIVTGALFALFATILLLFIFAFVINSAFPDPDAVLPYFTAAAASAGAFTGGFICAKKNGSGGLAAGFLTGCAVSLSVFLVYLFWGDKSAGSGFLSRLIVVACQVFFASIGGIAAVNVGSKQRRHTRRK